MKRSPMPPRTAPIRRGSAPERRARLKPRSAKTEAAYEIRRPMVAEIAATRRQCEGHARLHAAADESDADPRYAQWLRRCRRFEPCQPHEPLKRSRGGSIVDPDAVMWLCWSCHLFSEAEVSLATACGLLMPSWERGR